MLGKLLCGMTATALAVGLCGAAGAAPTPRTVVELFTSQGCSSCPPANDTLALLAGRPDILALSFGVTYWDQLGWKDTFASPAYTARQHDYAEGLKHRQVWTPQVVVDGRADTVGQSVAEVEPLIRAARARRAAGPGIEIGPDGVSIAGGPARSAPAEVWLVRYDPRQVQVPIRRGENGGRTLPHRNVVRDLVKLGAWSGAPARFAFKPAADPALKTAVLIQARSGGPILAAATG
jgi:hypothetical protein